MSYIVCIGPIHTSYNWQNDRLKYEESQIREMSSWIQTSKQAFKPIIGGGGTGKSYLINAIKILLKQSCAVTATT